MQASRAASARMAKTLQAQKKREKKRGYVGFDTLKNDLGHRPGVTNPGALAAYIGRKKYGKKRFNSAASKGKKLG